VYTTFRAVRITCVWAMALGLLCVVPARNTALRITIVAGDGAKYSAGAHANKPLMIQVADEVGKPVGSEGQLPTAGGGPRRNIFERFANRSRDH
jgi:hypothetical protein